MQTCLRLCHHFVLPYFRDNIDGGGDIVCKFIFADDVFMVVVMMFIFADLQSFLLILMIVVMMFIFADLHSDDRDQRC